MPFRPSEMITGIIESSGGCGLLRCNTCHSERKLDAEKITHYFGCGWPKCCEYTMTWVTGRQLLQETK